MNLKLIKNLPWWLDSSESEAGEFTSVKCTENYRLKYSLATELYFKLSDGTRTINFLAKNSNMLHLIDNIKKVDKGVMKGKFVIAKDKRYGRLYILVKGSPEYKTAEVYTNNLNKKLTKEELVVGDCYYNSSMEKMVYLGQHMMYPKASSLKKYLGYAFVSQERNVFHWKLTNNLSSFKCHAQSKESVEFVNARLEDLKCSSRISPVTKNKVYVKENSGSYYKLKDSWHYIYSGEFSKHQLALQLLTGIRYTGIYDASSSPIMHSEYKALENGYPYNNQFKEI